MESNEEKSIFKHSGAKISKPRINVITKEEFEDRAKQVFKILGDRLSKSFGPYGAPTMICDYPYKHVTKDGFTIMKNLSFDASETLLDQTIADLAEDICARLNYAVGDGTTTAVIATNAIYKEYVDSLKPLLSERNIMARDIMKAFAEIKPKIIDKLHAKAQPIRSEVPDELAKNIYDVVYISSNGDEEISNMISDLYRQLGSPSITCKASDNGETYSEIVTGYKLPLMLNDKLYINNEENECELPDADILILGTKVTTSIFEKIICPLNEECRVRNRHLIVAANAYDEVTTRNLIAPMLNREFKQNNGKINLILTTYRAVNEYQRKMVDDFAILCKTRVLTRSMTERIIELGWNGDTPIRHINEILPLDTRGIPDINVARFNEEGNGRVFSPEVTDFEGYDNFMDPIEGAFEVGYVKGCNLGLKDSTFKEFFCDQKQLEIIRKDAYDDMVEKEAKFKRLGSFSLDIMHSTERYNALKLKTSLIYVGGESELSRGMNRDTMDDAVKAAASAFNYGVVLGGNVNLIQACEEVMEEAEAGSVHEMLCRTLSNAYRNVYKTVLANAFSDGIVLSIDDNLTDMNLVEDNLSLLDKVSDALGTDDVTSRGLTEEYPTIKLHDYIVDLAVLNDLVYDVSSSKFTTDVINSMRTDEEVLIATIDLISILITGNQVVVTQRHNY